VAQADRRAAQDQPALLSTSIHDLLVAEGFDGSYATVVREARRIRRPRFRAAKAASVPGLGRIKLLKLSPAHVQQFIREELATGKGDRTVQLSHNTLRTALKQAELWGLVPRNVARLVTPRYSLQERRPFTRDEQLRILAAARDDPLYVLVRLAHASGLRQSELLGLQWRDLDLDEGWVRVSKQLGRDGTLRPLKTAAGRRAVPLPRVLVELLTATAASKRRCARTRSTERTTAWCSRPGPGGRSASATCTGRGRASSNARA
jgi:integrase